MAAFGSASYCRLSPDRLVILAGPERFVLKRDAAWVLADDKQSDRFKKWREKAELSGDLGKLVTDLPKNRELPLLGEVSYKTKEVDFQLLGGQPQTVKLTATSDGLVPDAAGKSVVAEIAKGLKMKPSTLILDMADTGGAVSEAKAWAKVVERFKSPEFFILVGDRQGLFWAHGAGAPTIVTPNQTAPDTHEMPPKTEQKPKPKQKEQPLDVSGILLWSFLGLSLAGNAVLIYLKIQSSKSDATQSFPVSHHERQLIEKVRDEQKRQGPSSNEEVIVGKMMESYDQYDKANNERLDLLKYRQFKEDFDVFDQQAKEIKRKSDERQQEIRELTASLRQSQAGQADLQKELGAAKDTIAALQSELRTAERLLDDVGQWQTNFCVRLEETAGQMRS